MTFARWTIRRRELEPLLNALNDFISRLNDALKQTEIFIAEAAHHIRTPLATGDRKANSPCARRGSQKTEHIFAISSDLSTGKCSATQLQDHAVVLYRMEQPERRTIKLLQCVNDMVSNFAPTAELRDIEIKVESNISTVLELYLDQTLLETALRNLLDNAVKYSEAEATISIGINALSDKCRISVRNRSATMIKIDTDLVKQFSRGANATNVVGSGLGLAIVREVMLALVAN